VRRPGSGSRRWPASPRWLAAAVGLAVYGLGALLAFSPRNPLSTTSLPGGGRGDAVQMAWFLAWTAHALAQRLDPFTTTLLDHPSVVDLADNTSVPLLGLIAAPVTAILGPVAALNVMLRLALFSSGASMFLVLRRWCASSSAAFLGGAIYGFGPYLASHASPSANLDLIFVPVPPLILACLDELICRRRHSALRGGAMLGLLVVAQLLIDPEILAELAVSGMLAAGLLAVSEHRRLRRLFAGLSRRLVVAGAGFVAVFGALSAWPVWSMLAAPGHLSGAVQSPAKLQGFHADLAELVLPAKAQLVDFPALAAAGRAAVASAAALGDTEHTGYLGLPLVLLVVLLAIIWRHAAQVRLGAAIALAALVCELGPRLDVDGHLSTIPLPEGLLAHVPLLWSVIPSRFSLEVCLGVAVVVAVGLDRMLAAGIRSWRGALGLASGVLAVACYLPQLPTCWSPCASTSRQEASCSATPTPFRPMTRPCSGRRSTRCDLG
jgi:hypothetical protein